MSPIWMLFRCRDKLERLRRFANEDNRDYAPFIPIRFLIRFKVRLERLRRFAKGDSRD